jgi:Cytochrome c biogenesis factor
MTPKKKVIRGAANTGEPMTRCRISQLLVAAAALTAVPLRAQCAHPIQRLIDEARYTNAENALRSQINARPSDDAAMDCAGRLFLAQDRSSEAVTWLENAVKLNPKSAEHHLWLGLALRTEGQKSGILSAPALIRRMKSELEQALALDPSLVDARYGLLQFYAAAPAMYGGGADKAREQALAILKLNPMRGHLGYAFVAEQEKDYPAAEKELLAAITARPDSDAAYGAAGAFYRRRERWADASAMYQTQLLKLSKETPAPKRSNVHYFLGLAEEKSGRHDEAAAEYHAALAANPNNENAKKALASLNAN